MDNEEVQKDIAKPKETSDLISEQTATEDSNQSLSKEKFSCRDSDYQSSESLIDTDYSAVNQVNSDNFFRQDSEEMTESFTQVSELALVHIDNGMIDKESPVDFDDVVNGNVTHENPHELLVDVTEKTVAENTVIEKTVEQTSEMLPSLSLPGVTLSESHTEWSSSLNVRDVTPGGERTPTPPASSPQNYASDSDDFVPSLPTTAPPSVPPPPPPVDEDDMEVDTIMNSSESLNTIPLTTEVPENLTKQTSQSDSPFLNIGSTEKLTNQSDFQTHSPTDTNQTTCDTDCDQSLDPESFSFKRIYDDSMITNTSMVNLLDEQTPGESSTDFSVLSDSIAGQESPSNMQKDQVSLPENKRDLLVDIGAPSSKAMATGAEHQGEGQSGETETPVVTSKSNGELISKRSKEDLRGSVGHLSPEGASLDTNYVSSPSWLSDSDQRVSGQQDNRHDSDLLATDYQTVTKVTEGRQGFDAAPTAEPVGAQQHDDLLINQTFDVMLNDSPVPALPLGGPPDLPPPPIPDSSPPPVPCSPPSSPINNSPVLSPVSDALSTVIPVTDTLYIPEVGSSSTSPVQIEVPLKSPSPALIPNLVPSANSKLEGSFPVTKSSITSDENTTAGSSVQVVADLESNSEESQEQFFDKTFETSQKSSLDNSGDSVFLQNELSPRSLSQVPSLSPEKHSGYATTGPDSHGSGDNTWHQVVAQPDSNYVDDERDDTAVHVPHPHDSIASLDSAINSASDSSVAVGDSSHSPPPAPSPPCVPRQEECWLSSQSGEQEEARGSQACPQMAQVEVVAPVSSLLPTSLQGPSPPPPLPAGPPPLEQEDKAKVPDVSGHVDLPPHNDRDITTKHEVTSEVTHPELTSQGHPNMETMDEDDSGPFKRSPFKTKPSSPLKPLPTLKSLPTIKPLGNKTPSLKPLSSAKPLSLDTKTLIPNTNVNSQIPPVKVRNKRSDSEPFQIEVLKGLAGLGIDLEASGKDYPQVIGLNRTGPVFKNGNIR